MHAPSLKSTAVLLALLTHGWPTTSPAQEVSDVAGTYCLVGVMEVGGNNAGSKVTEIIRANGGTGPEPWCGDFVAYCYRLSGSKAVTRNWAAVRLLRGTTGVTATRKPRRGDLVRYTFDHVGMFVRDRGDGTIETIEGNTGATGAVSDSRTGGDGVYRKVRPKSLVKDYLRVHR